MNQFPFGYERIHETSWAYLSSLLMLALFFKFNRFWSIRNADLFLLILIAPGILLVSYRSQQTTSASRPVSVVSDKVTEATTASQDEVTAENSAPDTAGQPPSVPAFDNNSAKPADKALIDVLEPVQFSSLTPTDLVNRAGYIWLFSCGGLLLLRMLLDPLLVRRPLLEPNLSIGGLVFLGCSLLTFIFADIINSQPQPGSLDGAIGAMKMVQREAAGDEARQELLYHGPGYALIHVVPSIPTFTAPNRQSGQEGLTTGARQPLQLEITAKILVIVSQIAMVFGLIAIGYYHFSNFRTGVGMAVIWLMMPYTIMYSGNAYHVLPAALMVWAVALYRHPWVSGIMLGLATGVAYYPLFLLPLWLSFYWETRVSRFVYGFAIAIGVCVCGLIFTSQDVWHFFTQLQAMFGFWLPRINRDLLQGIWVLGWDAWFRLPLLVAFVILSISFVFWPATKNLGTLIAYTSAIMIAVQFWHGYQGGTFVAWYLPLMLATIFRPNLSDRVAASQIPSHQRRLRIDPTQRVSPAA